MVGWFPDFFRLVWALFYWNARKTYFRLRRGRVRCPCQSISDSGRAYETLCEASSLWDRPRRFRRVCPLLVETPAGLRCSVDSAHVRPFWGRAFGLVGSSLLVIYLIGTLSIFTAFRVIGYRVSYWHVAWPPAWPQMTDARAEYFLRKGIAALETNNIKEALFSLSYAYTLAPDNYDVGFTLASLRQVASPGFSDRVYEKLLALHPERNDQTADAWHRALLARGDFGRVALLDVQQLTRPGASHLGYWTQSLLFSSQRLSDTTPLRDVLDKNKQLPAPWRRVFETTLLTRTGQKDQAVASLQQVWPGVTDAYIPYYQANALIDLDAPRAALALLDAYGTRIRDDERFRIRLDAYAKLGWRSVRLADVDHLLAPPPTGPVVELLCAHLTRYPDPAILDRIFARLKQSPLTTTTENHQAFAALFCAAGVTGDLPKVTWTKADLKQITGRMSFGLDALEEYFRRPQYRPIESLLPSVPLPLEITYALLARYGSGKSAPSI